MTDGSLRHYSWTAVLRKVAEPFAAANVDGATRRTLRGLSSASFRSSGSAPPPPPPPIAAARSGAVASRHTRREYRLPGFSLVPRTAS